MIQALDGEKLLLEAPEDLLEYAVRGLWKTHDSTSVTFGNGFILHIEVKGEQWSEFIDFRIANYVLKLQHDIFSFYEKVTGEKVDLRASKERLDPLTVRVKLTKGSSSIHEYLSDIAPILVDKMTGTEIAILIALALSLYAGYRMFSRHRESKEILAKAGADTETIKEMSAVAQTAMAVARTTQDANNYLLSQMTKDDVVETPQAGTLSREEARARVPAPVGPAPDQPLALLVDDNFEITVVNFSKQTYTIECGAEKFPTTARNLSPEDKTSLSEAIADADLNDKTAQLRLRLNIRVLAGQIKDAIIVQLNPPHQDGIKGLQETLASLK